MRKEQQQPHDRSILLKIWSEHVLRIKAKVKKFGRRKIRGF